MQNLMTLTLSQSSGAYAENMLIGTLTNGNKYGKNII